MTANGHAEGHAAGASPATLLALPVGTAMATVCLFGLAMILREAPGAWSVAAIALAAVIARVVASAFSHLLRVVPSGGGMFAFVGRSLGQPAAMAMIAPYAILVTLLGAVEALLLGHLVRQWSGIPPLLTACLTIVASWAICDRGVAPSLRIQAACTGLLVAGVAAFSLSSVGSALADFEGGMRIAALIATPPSPEAFAGALGQAIFLFMGFELACAQVEMAGAKRVGHAMRGSIVVLAIVYATLALGLQLAPDGTLRAQLDGASGGDLAAFSTIADGARGPWIAALCLLAALTSLNGAFAGLSRLVAVLASQRLLPAALGAVDARTRVPRRSLLALLAAALGAAIAIDAGHAERIVVLAVAVWVALVYALAILLLDRAPFAGSRSDPIEQTPRPASGIAAWTRRSVALLLVLISCGVVVDSGDGLVGLSVLLLVTAGIGVVAARRAKRPRRPVANGSGAR